MSSKGKFLSGFNNVTMVIQKLTTCLPRIGRLKYVNQSLQLMPESITDSWFTFASAARNGRSAYISHSSNSCSQQILKM